jgi:drug/metabolite transporter (DMT)-like permease
VATLALVFVTLVWGTTFLLVQDALADISPGRFLVLRFALSAAVLAPVALAQPRGARDARGGARTILHARTWRDGALLGFLLLVGYATQTLGLLWTTTATSAFLTGLSVVLVPVLGLLFVRERLSAWTWGGVLVAAVGMGALTLKGGVGLGPGEALTLVCAVAFAAEIRVLAVAAPGSQPVALTTAMLACAALCAVLALPLDGWLAAHGAKTPPPGPLFAPLSARAWWALLVCGLLGTGLAFLVQSWAQRRLSPTRVGMLFALEPVFAAIVAWVWGGERFGARGFAGMVLILAGIVVVETLGREPESAATVGEIRASK